MTEEEYQKKIKQAHENGELTNGDEVIEWSRKNPPPEWQKLIEAARKECAPFSFPCVDRPELWEALQELDKVIKNGSN